MRLFIVVLVLVIIMIIGRIIYLKRFNKKEQFASSTSKIEEINKQINYLNYLIELHSGNNHKLDTL